MARGGTNKELAATVLIEAAYIGDEKACERYGLALRSLQRYRKALAEGDTELAEFVAKKRKAFDQEWAAKIPIALSETVEYLTAVSAAAKTDKLLLRNPMMVSAAAGGMKLLADVMFTGKIIDARIAQTNRPADGIPGEIPAETDGESSPLIH